MKLFTMWKGIEHCQPLLAVPAMLVARGTVVGKNKFLTMVAANNPQFA